MQPEPTHNAYLNVVCGPANTSLIRAMEEMGRTAGAAARSQDAEDLMKAQHAMAKVQECAISFRTALASVTVPSYMRGADGQLQDAMHLIADGARRGIDASAAADGSRLTRAATEIEVANRGVVSAALRIVAWQQGAAQT